MKIEFFMLIIYVGTEIPLPIVDPDSREDKVEKCFEGSLIT